MIKRNEKFIILPEKTQKISEFILHLAAYGGLTFKERIITMWNDHHVLTPISTFYLLQKELVKRYKENIIYLSF